MSRRRFKMTPVKATVEEAVEEACSTFESKLQETVNGARELIQALGDAVGHAQEVDFPSMFG